MHLRFATRLHFIAVLVTVSLLTYAFWSRSSLRRVAGFTKPWATGSKVLVVFGDSFSDTGEHIDGPNIPNLVLGEQPDNFRWTAELCSELDCNTVLNFARSAAGHDVHSGGVVADNGVYANTTGQKQSTLLLLPDLKEQIQEWIKFENQSDTAQSDDEYIFALTLGFWDVWQFASLDLETAQNAIANSIFVIFEQLDLIAELFDEPVSFILPKVVDSSFTPRFISLAYDKDSQSRRHSEEHHKLVYLTKYWNIVLAQHAANWRGSYIYLPEWNTWLLDQIRSVQLKSLGIFDALGIGVESPVFKDARNPCSTFFVSQNEVDGKGPATSVSSQCDHPEEHLFWDDTQFSANAHELLGLMAARLLGSNAIANDHVMNHAFASNGSDEKSTVAKPHLVPSLAPGN